MIRQIITYSAHHRFAVVLATIFFVGIGFLSLKNIPLDAIPDLSDTQVIVYSKWDRSPEIIEKQVTYPLISTLLGSPKVKSVRGFSDYGYSFIYVIFEDGTDLYWARSRVTELLNRATNSLPRGVQTEIGPDATSVGWIFQYAIVDESGKMNSSEIRSIQDWNIRYQLQSVPGVAEIASIGGYVRQFQVRVEPQKMALLGVTLEQVQKAIQNSNQESSGRVIEFSGTEAMVRTQGLVTSIADLENAVVSFPEKSRAPVLIKQVATVSMGPEQRRGISDFNGKGDTVSGIVVMRQGEDAPSVIGRVKEKIRQIQATLPEGLKIRSVYDRSDLIFRALKTLRTTLIEELLIVSFIILLFLWHLPSAIVPILTIPVAVLLAFIPLYLFNQSSNIMSLAGIAISIGVLVDGAIVEVENAYRKIHIWNATGRRENFFTVRLAALTEVGPAVFFSLLVVAVAFLPIFTLVDQEGRLFRPLALSKNLTMLMAALLAITLDPALRMLFSRPDEFHGRFQWLNRLGNAFFVGRYHSETQHPISRRLIAVYEPLLHWVLKKKKLVLSVALIAVLTTIPGLYRLGSEFMPTLHEGSLLYMPTALPGLSVSEAQRILTRQNEIIKSLPEVESVYGKAGRAETSTDTAPLSMIETTIVLKDKSQWRKVKVPYWPWPVRITDEELVEELNSQLNFLGMPNIWTMPIKNRIDMLSTGIRSPIGIKLFGDDLRTIERLGRDVESALRDLPGTRSVIAERIASGYFLDVNFDRQKIQHFGLSLKDAQDQAMGTIGGENVSTAILGRERYPIQVRAAPDFRQDIAGIKRTLISTPTGAQIPLSDIAEVKINEGPAMIRNENASLVGYVYVDVDTQKTDIGSYVEQAKKRVESMVKLPIGHTLTWSGQFENMERVKRRLFYVIPLTLLLIVFLLQLNTRSWTKTSIVLLAVPFSLIGAVWFLAILDYHLSIATWVGIIALLGLDAETGVFMLMYLDLAYEERQSKGSLRNINDLHSAVIEGAVHRVRPKLMTVMALFMGLIPIMWSTGTGADVMKRIAAPMIGGLASSFILELFIYPILFFLWKSKTVKWHNSK